MYALLLKICEGDLRIPLKWMSVSQKWFFEKQSDLQTRWIEYNNDSILNIFNEISFNFEVSGFPVVTLKRLQDSDIIKLTQYMLLVETNSTTIKREGYWIQKDGRFCLSSLFFPFIL